MVVGSARQIPFRDPFQLISLPLASASRPRSNVTVLKYINEIPLQVGSTNERFIFFMLELIFAGFNDHGYRIAAVWSSDFVGIPFSTA
jgi:hypothetical protein